jgi:hypothetical protein
MRHSTPLAATFTPVEKIALNQLVAHLRSAARFPLRVAVIGTATFVDDDAEAEPISYDRTVGLGECGSLQDAIIATEIRIAHDDIESSAGGRGSVFAARRHRHRSRRTACRGR